MTLKKLRKLQALNNSLKNAINMNTIILVDNLANNHDVLSTLSVQQLDIEQQLLDNLACFQAIQYQPKYDGLNANFSA